MARKASKHLKLALALLALNFGLWYPPAIVPAQATTVVGSAAALKGNGVNSVTALPSQSATPICFSVKATSSSATQIMAADGGRMSFYIINSSTQPLSPTTGQNYSRPPLVYITTSSAVNQTLTAAAWVPSQLPLLIGLPLTPMLGAGGSGNPGFAGDSTFAMSGNNVYRGALFVVGEGSATATYDTLPYVQGCSFDP